MKSDTVIASRLS